MRVIYKLNDDICVGKTYIENDTSVLFDSESRHFGKKPFMEKEDAKKVGKLVMRRMKTGENYTVTRHDLENL